MAFLFLTQGVFVNMDLCEQIDHFSDFISHYQVHKEYGGDSFSEYVVEKLFSEQGDSNAHHNDSHEENSPTHSHHQCYHSTVFLAPSHSVLLKTLVSDESTQNTYYPFQFNSRYLESLFQPPRA